MKSFPEALQKIWNAVRPAIPWILVIASPLALFALIDEHKVNIPFLDDWMFVYMFEKARAGTLTLHDFFAVQMEHRMAFVRLVILALHKLWPTDYTKWMWVSWLLLVGTYANVGVLLRRTTGLKFSAWWPLLALAGLAIFSPVQYRIVLWAMMFQVACPGFFLSLTLVALTSRWPLWVRWMVGVMGATCATQTLAAGLLVWLLPLPLVFWGQVIRNRRDQWIFAGSWLAVFAATAALYFTDLKNEADAAFAYKQKVGEESLQHDTKAFFTQPHRSVPYVMRFLGGHLARGTGWSLMDASLVIGGISLALFVGVAIYGLVHFRREELRARLLPWLSFGSYSVCAGVLVAMGRMWAAQTGENALAARYAIHAVPLTVSLIALCWLVWRDLRERSARMDAAAPHVVTAAAVVSLVVLLLPWPAGCRLMEMWESARLRGAASTLFFNTINAMEDLVPSNRDLARRANNMGLLDPPMLKERWLDQFKRSDSLLTSNSAQWSTLAVQLNEKGEEWLGLVRGHAFLPSRQRAADAVLLTYRKTGEDRWMIFHVTQVAAMPLFLLQTLGIDTQFVHLQGELRREATGAFGGRFYLAQLPDGVSQLAAWVLDYRTWQVFPIRGCFEIDTDAHTVKRLADDPRTLK